MDETYAEMASARLFKTVADMIILSTKTLHCHWNMKDSRFYSLHELLDSQYHELLDQADLIAERIRQLRRPVPANLSLFLAHARLTEMVAIPTGDEMISELAASHQKIVLFLRDDIAFSDSYDDAVTSDILTGIARDEEKKIWILQSHLA
ncbi:MAG: DNA starvation/stationary phase protection protein [Chlamydia sp.]